LATELFDFKSVEGLGVAIGGKTQDVAFRSGGVETVHSDADTIREGRLTAPEIGEALLNPLADTSTLVYGTDGTLILDCLNERHSGNTNG